MHNKGKRGVELCYYLVHHRTTSKYSIEVLKESQYCSEEANSEKRKGATELSHPAWNLSLFGLNA